jgi:hypothetical protein
VLEITAYQPYLSVLHEGVSKVDEVITHKSETRNTNELTQNTKKIQQKGENGTKEVTYICLYKNGVLMEQVKSSEVVTKEPVTEIVLVGTKPPATAGSNPNSGSSSGSKVPGTSLSLSDQEMLNYIINRESSGNIYATNGIYKGIGQLQEDHYRKYVGMSYADTLKKDYPYAVQLQAMMGYINERYGSVASAYRHWVSEGWY